VKAAKTDGIGREPFANAQRFSNRRYNYICAKNITCKCEGLHHTPEIFRYMTADVDTTTCTTPALGKGHLSLLASSALECGNIALKHGDKSGDAGNARYDTYPIWFHG
jgi:hypothetical protein